MDIPQNVEYIKDWAAQAASVMGLKLEDVPSKASTLGLDIIERRFEAHIETGIAVNAPAIGPFSSVFLSGVRRGWISREKAIEWVFSVMDASVRPKDRKAWLDVLGELELSDQELHSRTQALIPLLALGETNIIVRLASTLIAQADADLLAEVLLAAFSGKTKKAKKTVLQAAIDCPRPEGAENLALWLSVFAEDTDKSIASPATQLIQRWGLNSEALPAEDDSIQGFWRETPPVWDIPSFELGEVSPEALTQLAATLMNRQVQIHDVTLERFWAVLNAVAHQNLEAARMSLRGLRPMMVFYNL